MTHVAVTGGYFELTLQHNEDLAPGDGMRDIACPSAWNANPKTLFGWQKLRNVHRSGGWRKVNRKERHLQILKMRFTDLVRV